MPLTLHQALSLTSKHEGQGVSQLTRQTVEQWVKQHGTVKLRHTYDGLDQYIGQGKLGLRLRPPLLMLRCVGKLVSGKDGMNKDTLFFDSDAFVGLRFPDDAHFERATRILAISSRKLS